MTPQTLAMAVNDLKEERAKIAKQLERLDSAILILSGPSRNSAQRNSRPQGKMSAAARKRIGDATRRRWAKMRQESSAPKRTMSAAARRKIAAAQRARWAKLKKK